MRLTQSRYPYAKYEVPGSRQPVPFGWYARSVFEKRFDPACLELERSERGDPLGLDRFRPSWTTAQCIERARRIVSAPDWRGSGVRFDPDPDPEPE